MLLLKYNYNVYRVKKSWRTQKCWIANILAYKYIDKKNKVKLDCYCHYSPDDVTVTMYTAAYQKSADDKEFPNKVNVVCDAVRQALIDVNENK